MLHGRVLSVCLVKKIHRQYMNSLELFNVIAESWKFNLSKNTAYHCLMNNERVRKSGNMYSLPDIGSGNSVVIQIDISALTIARKSHRKTDSE